MERYGVDVGNALQSLPHVLMRPRLFIDGGWWCALYGEDLQSGVSGFGASPEEAMKDFDRMWRMPLQARPELRDSEQRISWLKATCCSCGCGLTLWVCRQRRETGGAS